ncbi:MAG: geranylgeranyl reductase family protein [Candidatus Aenigmatarchaeota archaeon]
MLKNVYDVIVVGAGPAGCKTAEIASAKGLRVLILEEHEKVGRPIKCTGLVSNRIIELSGIRAKKIILNTIKKARIYNQNKKFLELESKKPAYVIARDRFDKQLFKLAIKNGAEFSLGCKFKKYTKEGKYLSVETSDGYYKCKLLVGADGPTSSVAKNAGIYEQGFFLIAYQETIKGEYEDFVELWFGKNISPDFFAWVVPENKKWARVGLAAKSDVQQYFRNFLNIRFQHIEEKKDILGGIIKFGLIKTSVSSNVLLVGDAAMQVKPFSGGGIIYGLIAARFAASACVKAIKENRFDENFLKKEYDEKWKGALFPAIKRGMFLHCLTHNVPEKLFPLFLKSTEPFKWLLNKIDMDLLFTL